MTEPQTSGVDLARVALQAARTAAKQRPTGPRAAQRKRRTSRRTDGRDPVGLGSAINSLMTDRGWEAPAAGGNVLDQWPTIAPELAGTVHAERYDSETGTLHLRPVSPTYAAHLRLLGRQLVERINTKTGRAVVRAIRVMPPGLDAGRPAAGTPDLAPAAAVPADAPVRTRDDAHPGYHHARAAINHTPPASRIPRIQRDWGTGAFAWLREPPDAFTDAVAAQETAAAEASRGNDPDAVRQAAIRMARAEKAGRGPAVPTAFQRSA